MFCLIPFVYSSFKSWPEFEESPENQPTLQIRSISSSSVTLKSFIFQFAEDTDVLNEITRAKDIFSRALDKPHSRQYSNLSQTRYSHITDLLASSLSEALRTKSMLMVTLF